MKTADVLALTGRSAPALGEGALSAVAERLQAEAEAHEEQRIASQEQRSLAAAMLPNLKLAERERQAQAHAALFNNAAPAVSREDFWRSLKTAAQSAPKDVALKRAAAHAQMLYQGSMEGILTIGDVARFRTHYAREYPKSRVASVVDAALDSSGYQTLPLSKLRAVAAKIDAQCSSKMSEDEMEEVFVEECRQAGLASNDLQAQRSRGFIRGLLRLANAEREHADPIEAAHAVMAMREDAILRVAQELYDDTQLPELPDEVPMADEVHLDTPAEHEAKEEAVPHEELTEEVAPVMSPNSGEPLVVEVALADEEEIVEMGMLDEFDLPSTVVEDPSAPGESLEITLSPTQNEEPYDVYAVEDETMAEEPLQTIEAASMPAAMSRLVRELRASSMDTSAMRVLASAGAFTSEAMVALSPREGLLVRRRSAAPVEPLTAEQIETKILAAQTVTARDWSISADNLDVVVKRGEREVQRASLDHLDDLIGTFRAAAYEEQRKKVFTLQAALPNNDAMNARRIYLAARELLPNVTYKVTGSKIELRASADASQMQATARVIAARFGVEAQIISTAPQPTYQPPPRTPEPQSPQPPSQPPPQPTTQMAPMTQPAPQGKEAQSRLTEGEVDIGSLASYQDAQMQLKTANDVARTADQLMGQWIVGNVDSVELTNALMMVPEALQDLVDSLTMLVADLDGAPKAKTYFENRAQRAAEVIPIFAPVSDTDRDDMEVVKDIESKLEQVRMAIGPYTQDEWLGGNKETNAWRQRLAQRDERVEVIRSNRLVGKGSASSIDETMDDADIVAALDAEGIKTPEEALRWAFAQERRYIERWLNTEPDDPELVEELQEVLKALKKSGTRQFQATLKIGGKITRRKIEADKVSSALRIAQSMGEIVEMEPVQETVDPIEQQMGGGMQPLTDEERGEIESAMRTYRNQGLTIDEAVAEFRSSFKQFLQTKGDDQSTTRQIVGGEVVAAAMRAWSRPAILSTVAKVKKAAPTPMSFTFIDDGDEVVEVEANDEGEDEGDGEGESASESEMLEDLFEDEVDETFEAREDYERDLYERKQEAFDEWELRNRDRSAQKIFEPNSRMKFEKNPKPSKVMQGGDESPKVLSPKKTKSSPKSSPAPTFETGGDLPSPSRTAPKPKKRTKPSFQMGDVPTPSKG